MTDTPKTPASGEELREAILTLGVCTGPYDTPHQCSALHCNHCGLCDESENLIALIQSQQERAVREALQEGYDPNRLGSWVFIGDNARLNNLDDLYWSYVAEYCAAQDPYRPDSQYGDIRWLKKQMPHASFSQVGHWKMLARADQHAKERLGQLSGGEE